jgi:hypothetical protein
LFFNGGDEWLDLLVTCFLANELHDLHALFGVRGVLRMLVTSSLDCSHELKDHLLSEEYLKSGVSFSFPSVIRS